LSKLQFWIDEIVVFNARKDSTSSNTPSMTKLCNVNIWYMQLHQFKMTLVRFQAKIIGFHSYYSSYAIPSIQNDSYQILRKKCWFPFSLFWATKKWLISIAFRIYDLIPNHDYLKKQISRKKCWFSFSLFWVTRKWLISSAFRVYDLIPTPDYLKIQM